MDGCIQGFAGFRSRERTSESTGTSDDLGTKRMLSRVSARNS